MGLGNTLNILRPPGVATTPIQTGWNEDLVKNLHNVLGEMSQQIKATSTVSTSSLTSFDTKTILEAATVPLVVDALQLTGYTTAGDGGAALYKRVGAEPSHALKIQSNDGAWWELVPDHGYINVKQAGAVGDDTTNDGQAFIDALSFAELAIGGGLASGYGVIVPPSDTPYYLGANTLELKRVVHFVGQGAGQGGYAACKLRWDANITGIIVHRADTIGAGVESDPLTFEAGGSKIEGLQLDSDGGTIAAVTDSTKGHGIWLRSRATLTDLIITDFPGNGINIVATAIGADDVRGNANNWTIDRAKIRGCHLNGIFVDGADVNAGMAQNVDVSNNGRWGIHDSSFLGNAYISVHAANNGLGTIGENGVKSSLVSFGGNLYAANATAPASEADLVATTPGTDELVWIFLDTGDPADAQPLWLASQTEGTYFLGGPYHTDSNSARNVFVSCYVENGQGPVQFVRPTLSFGGLIGRVRGSGLVHKDDGVLGKMVFQNHASYVTSSRNLTLEINTAADKLLSVIEEGGHSKGTNILSWDEANGLWRLFEYANSVRAMHLTTNLNTDAKGRSTALLGGQIFFNLGFWVGPGGRNFSSGSAARTTGDRAVGDFELNNSPSVGAPMGWVCTTAHATAPTFTAIYGVGTQQSNIVDPTGGGTVDTEARTAINSLIAALEHFGFTST